MKRVVVLGVICGFAVVGLANLVVWLGGRTPVTKDPA